MSKKIFTKKEVNKILFSETIKKSEIPWLIDLMKIGTGLSKIDLSAEQLQIVNELRSALLNDSIEEWNISKGPEGKLTLDMGDDNRRWMKCQLCGTKNRYIHYIKNKYSKITINIGSDCVDEFGEIGSIANRDRRSLVSNQSKIRRLNRLLEEIPNAKSRIEKWNNFLSNLEIILPIKHEEAYIELGKKAEKLFKRILSVNKNEQEIEQLKRVFIKQDKYKDKILKYVDLNKENNFVYTREIDDWLRINRPNDHSRIKETVQNEGNGFIGSNIAHEINEPDFLEMLATEYSNNINTDMLRIKQVTSNGFVISVAPFFNVDLEISNKLFTKEYGSFAYGEKGLFDNELLLNKSRCRSNRDRSNLIEEYNVILNNIKMKIVNVEPKKNRMDFENLSPKKYYREDYEKFIENNKLFLYLNQQNALKKEILKNNNSFTASEYKNLIKREKEIKTEYLKDIKR